jgi:hypothetical protein
MDKPLCGKCDKAHWRFVACADVAPEVAPAKVMPVPVWRSGNQSRFQTRRAGSDFGHRNYKPPNAA